MDRRHAAGASFRRAVKEAARKLRLDFPGAIYHVINRGNRRVGPFGAARTRDAFEACLFDACVRSRWVDEANRRGVEWLAGGTPADGERDAREPGRGSRRASAQVAGGTNPAGKE